MDKKWFEEFRIRVFSQEGNMWESHLMVRETVENSYDDLLKTIGILDQAAAVQSGFTVVKKALGLLENLIDLSQVDPGHGIGHLSRDLVNANLLSEELLEPADLYIGIVASALHDILGCSLIDRYSDKHRALKHAEVSALLWLEIAKELGVSKATILLTYYSIAGHTHLLKDLTVRCEDGIDRVCQPYLDVNLDGSPRMMFWFPRMVDRCDLIGPAFLGRHFLTMHKDHHDYDGGYFPVTLAAHMRPLLRGEEEIKSDPNGRTLREHLALFARSQTNESIYGRFDGQVMQQIRDASQKRSLKIIDSFDLPLEILPNTQEEILERWTAWLKRIEPSASGRSAAENLKKRFLSLPDETRACWIDVMATAMDEYRFWRIDQLQRLSLLDRPHLVFPIIGDIQMAL